MKTKKVVTAIAAISVLALIVYQIILVAEDLWVVLDSIGNLVLGIGIGGLFLSRQSELEKKSNEKKMFIFWMVAVLFIFGLVNKSSFLVLYSIGIPIGYFGCQIIMVYFAHKYLRKCYIFWLELSKQERDNVLKHLDVFWKKRWGDTAIVIENEDEQIPINAETIKSVLEKASPWRIFIRSSQSAIIGTTCDFINFFIPFINQKQMIKNLDEEIYGDHIKEVSPELVVQRHHLKKMEESFVVEWGIRPDE